MEFNKTLIAGPWVGEFGWELLCWQGYIRSLKDQYDKIIVISRPGRQALYEDFADEYYEYQPGWNCNMWICNDINKNVIQEYYDNIIKKYGKCDIERPRNIGFQITPNGDIPYTGTDFWNQSFVKYQFTDTTIPYTDVILHPRNKNVGSDRNWPKEKWVELVKMLKLNGVKNIGITGNERAFYIEGCLDFRSYDLKQTIVAMNQTKMVIGPSSGPMHLASLSGVKHLVWSTEYNKTRYLKAWNPFNTECIFYDQDGWDPNIQNLLKTILNEI
jgi:hypothetical protein